MESFQVLTGGKGYFLGGPVVRTSPSSAGGAGSKISRASRPEKQNTNSRSNIVTNSIKTYTTINKHTGENKLR